MDPQLFKSLEFGNGSRTFDKKLAKYIYLNLHIFRAKNGRNKL